MTSLIFWGPYLAHKAVIDHRREKKRIKNYERWEGLRDEYDEMKKVTTSQRNSFDHPQPAQEQAPTRHSMSSDRDLFTLRDQQEAGDARRSWRPQEKWEAPSQPAPTPRPAVQADRNVLQRLSKQKTGATWDEGLPAPLQVSRRSYDDNGRWKEERESSLSASSSRHDVTATEVRRSISRESVEAPPREEVHVVESPYEWWK